MVFVINRKRTMIFKSIVVIVLLVILSSLGSGLVFLIRDRGSGHRAVKALTLRIALSVALFALLMIAYLMGLITPHGIYPTSQ
jgi:hypothetical protein